MDLTGKQVVHEKFGTGTVTEQSESSVSVQFNAGVGLRKFLYPSAFAAFLRLCSEDDAGAMDAELEKRRSEEAARRRVAEQEEEKRCRNARASVLEQKRVTASKKRSSARKKAVKKRLDAFETESEDPELAPEEDFIEDAGDVMES